MLKINKTHEGNKGLTLLELLVTIAVLTIVATIAIPIVTNLVVTASDKTVSQTRADVQDFVKKYNKAGAYTYSDGVFSGYVDLNGDGAASDDEKIEELVVDTDKFSITPSDDNAPSDATGANFYETTPETTFTVGGGADSTSLASSDSVYLDKAFLDLGGITSTYDPVDTSIIQAGESSGTWSETTPFLIVVQSGTQEFDYKLAYTDLEGAQAEADNPTGGLGEFAQWVQNGSSSDGQLLAYTETGPQSGYGNPYYAAYAKFGEESSNTNASFIKGGYGSAIFKLDAGFITSNRLAYELSEITFPTFAEGE